VGNTWYLLFGIAVVLILGVGFYFQHKARKKKIAAFTAFAGQRGWTYTQRDRSLVSRFLGDPFGEGHGRDVEHVLRGEHRGRTIMVFEYSYRETHGSGNEQRTETYRFTVAALSLPAGKPTLQVSREGFGRKLLGIVGVRDLQLESEQFNTAFHIKTDNDRFAYDILHPRMMEWMLADQRAMSVPFRFERGDLMTWNRGRIDLTKVEWMLEYLCDVVDRVPSFVWNS
jgi:hypothetical protein